MSRIALVSTFYPYRGGIAQFGAKLYRQLEADGHQVKAWNFSRQYPNLLFPGKSQLVPEGDVADPIPTERTMDSIAPWTWYQTARQINNWEPELVITKYWMPFLAPCLGTVAGRIKAPVIASLDNVTPHEPRMGDRMLNRYFLNRCHAFLAMSSTVKDDVLDLLPNARIGMKPHPVYDHITSDLSGAQARAKLGLDPDLPVLLFFGFIRDYKGLDLLLEATAPLDKPVQVLIAGEAYGDFSKYQSLIDQHPHKAQIHVHQEYIADGDAGTFFRAANACVLPYRSATQSGIAALALQFETPMISTQVGGLGEYISHNQDGLLVPPGDVEALSASITHFLSSGLESSFRNALTAKKQDYSWAAYTSALLDLA